MQTPVVRASARAGGPVALFKEHRLCGAEVAAEKPGRREGDGDYLSVDKHPPGTFPVAPCSEPNAQGAVHSGDCGVQGRSDSEKVM